MQDPFYHKEKRRKKARALDADAWLDSFLYEFWNSIGRGYQRIEDFFHAFRLRGVKRFFVEIISDGASFTAIGAVLMLALALPAFQATASGRINNANEVSVLFLDLDQFKLVNESFGHQVGDRLLVEVARRLESCLRATDTVARLHGPAVEREEGDAS